MCRVRKLDLVPSGLLGLRLQLFVRNMPSCIISPRSVCCGPRLLYGTEKAMRDRKRGGRLLKQNRLSRLSPQTSPSRGLCPKDPYSSSSFSRSHRCQGRRTRQLISISRIKFECKDAAIFFFILYYPRGFLITSSTDATSMSGPHNEPAGNVVYDPLPLTSDDHPSDALYNAASPVPSAPSTPQPRAEDLPADDFGIPSGAAQPRFLGARRRLRHPFRRCPASLPRRRPLQ